MLKALMMKILTDLLLFAPAITRYPVKCVLMTQRLGRCQQAPVNINITDL